MNNANNTETTSSFLFAGTTFEVVSYYQGECFKLYQISRSRGRDAVKSFTIDDATDRYSLEYAAVTAAGAR